jgi:hypothetical protein
MKIGEIEVGKEYALTQGRGDPRRVLAVEIVTVDDPVWSTVLETYTPRSVRKVKVKYLDKPTERYTHAKGAEHTVSHRELVALWKDIGPGIRKRIEEEARQEALRDDLEKRLRKLLGKNYDGYVTVMGARGANLDLYGKSLTKLLDLAEKGAAV